MDRCLTRLDIDALLADALPTSQRHEVDGHLSACRRCRDLVESLRSGRATTEPDELAGLPETVSQPMPTAILPADLAPLPAAPPSIPSYEILGEIHRGGQGIV